MSRILTVRYVFAQPLRHDRDLRQPISRPSRFLRDSGQQNYRPRSAPHRLPLDGMPPPSGCGALVHIFFLSLTELSLHILLITVFFATPISKAENVATSST